MKYSEYNNWDDGDNLKKCDSWGRSYRVVINELVCDIVASSNFSGVITFEFRLVP